MDCRVASLLAMTRIGLNMPSRSRGAMRPEFSISFALWKRRGRGEDRVRAAPAVSQACCKEICCPRAYRFSGEHTGFPHAMALRLIRDRPGDPAFCDTIALGQRWLPLNLTPASGRRTQTISPYATDALVFRTIASTAPCPAFATTADAPLVGQDGGSCAFDLPDGASGIFLREGLDRLLVICPSGYFVAAGRDNCACVESRSSRCADRR